jgi:hypothetical protein
MEMTTEQVSRLQPLPQEEEEEEEEEEEDDDDDDDDNDEILLSFKFVSINHILNTFHEIS